MGKADAAGARSRSRELILQALYQKQISGTDCSDLMEQFRVRDRYLRADREYFDDTLPSICEKMSALESEIDELTDRPLSQLDPVETAILLLGFFELRHRQDVPYKVVIDESIELAKRFGATDGHKYINAVLDKAAGKLRPAESSGSAKRE